MSAVLSPLRLAALPDLKQPRPTTSPEYGTAATQLAPILCGGGLIACGLWRGSWLGLTLAAVGGFLLYRGLTSSLAPVTGRRLDAFDNSQTEAEADGLPTVILLPPINGGREAVEDADIGEAVPTSPSQGMTRDVGLTAEEHGKAEVAAYYCALRRGGGRLPPYQHAEAVEDFCWAAELILCQRP